MVADQYNEFGNDVEPELESDDEEENDIPDRESEGREYDEDRDDMEDLENNTMAMQLHDDKRYYPSEVDYFGPDVEIVVYDEDE